MRMFASSMLAAILVFGTAATPATATEKHAKMSDLYKQGYTCKLTGPDRNVCTKKEAATYGCERNDCIAIGRTAGGGFRAPTGGVLNPRL